jgi:hypothetical protein
VTCASYTWKVKLMNLLFSNFYGRNCSKLYSPTAKSGGNFVEVNKAALKTTATLLLAFSVCNSNYEL